MQHSHRLPISSDPLPPRLLSRLAGFADLFTRPTWSNVLVLLAGVILAPGRRTVTALPILGRDRDPDFCTFHRILNRAAWSSRALAGRLLILLIKAFVPSGHRLGQNSPAAACVCRAITRVCDWAALDRLSGAELSEQPCRGRHATAHMRRQ
jgi:hypothetical protein